MINSVHIDFHTQGNITDFGKSYDPERLADILFSAGVQRVNLFARCNQGYSYYPSQIAERYPYMKIDMFGDTLCACRKKGISVFAYFNAATNIIEARRHPDWERKEPEGECLCDDPTSPFTVIMCLSSGYRKYLLDTLDEILKYDPDGIFADNILPLTCDCPSCRSASGGDIHKYAFESSLSLCSEIKERLGDKTRLNIKGMPYESVGKLCDSFYVWENYDELSLCIGDRKKTEHLVGRFIKSWGDFGGYAGYESLDDAYCSALFRGCGFCLGDHLHPVKNLDERIYSDYGKIISAHKEEAKTLDGTEPVYDCAILVGDSGSLNDSAKGAAKLLSELHILYNIVTPSCKELNKYDYLIIPSELSLNSSEAANFNVYRGGIIAAGEVSALIDRIKPFSPVKAKTNSPYYILGEEMPYSAYSEAYSVNGLCTPLALLCTPYNDRERRDDFPYYYTPPAKAEGVIAGYSGRDAYIGFDIFSSYLSLAPQSHKKLFKSALEAICAKNTVLAEDLPSYAKTSFFSSRRGGIYQIKLPTLGREAVTLSGGRIIFNTGYSSALFAGSPLPLKNNGNKTIVELPAIKGFGQIILQS